MNLKTGRVSQVQGQEVGGAGKEQAFQTEQDSAGLGVRRVYRDRGQEAWRCWHIKCERASGQNEP